MLNYVPLCNWDCHCVCFSYQCKWLATFCNLCSCGSVNVVLSQSVCSQKANMASHPQWISFILWIVLICYHNEIWHWNERERANFGHMNPCTFLDYLSMSVWRWTREPVNPWPHTEVSCCQSTVFFLYGIKWVAQMVMLITCIWGVSILNMGWGTICSDWSVCGFYQAAAGIECELWSQPLPAVIK
jgi:hypothetical protein